MLWGIAFTAGWTRGAVAQDSKVSLEVSLSPDTAASGVRWPMVRLRSLLEDSRWQDALQHSFPLRLHFHLEVWRSRENWIDQFERAVEWEVVVRREALFDQYTVFRYDRNRRPETQYNSLEALGAALGSTYLIRVRPGGVGKYYFTISVDITTLSNTDLEDLERFIQGVPDSATNTQDRLPEGMGQGARRFLLRVAGMPSTELERRTETFLVRSPPPR